MVANPKELGEGDEIVVPEISEKEFDRIFDNAYESASDEEDDNMFMGMLAYGINITLSDECEIILNEQDVQQEIKLACTDEKSFKFHKNKEEIRTALKTRLEIFNILKITKSIESDRGEIIKQIFSKANFALEGASRTLNGVTSSIPPAPKPEKIKEFGISFETFEKIHSNINGLMTIFMQDLATALANAGMQATKDDIKTALMTILQRISKQYGVKSAHESIRKNPKKLRDLLNKELRKSDK